MKTLGCLGVALLLVSTPAVAEQPWKVHEWGTFTSLQDEAGETIGGINTDDEPVPDFVHRLASFILLRPTEIPATFFQGAPSCHPDVTMRLETPVIYFHPPKSGIQNADVRVKFRGGWLTEFFPAARPDAPGLRDGRFQFPHLRSDTESKLEWNDLKIGGDWPLANTSAHVWTSPRAVRAALVQTTNGESERFLFYRGVAHINAPLKISRAADQLVFRSQLEQLPIDQPLAIRSSWLVDIQSDGKIAFRSLPSMKLDPDPNKILTQTPAAFRSGEFTSRNLKKLKAALHSALVAEGLFADEAEALLTTWELSYFKSAGLRVFFIVPPRWTDFYLPLEISVPADLKRVMVGRVELITPEQRSGLEKLAHYPAKTIDEQASRLFKDFYASRATGGETWQQLTSGRQPLATVVSVPKCYQTYLDLGRFRNALILDEARHRPTEGLTNFIAKYRLQAYTPVDTPPESAP